MLVSKSTNWQRDHQTMATRTVMTPANKKEGMTTALVKIWNHVVTAEKHDCWGIPE